MESHERFATNETIAVDTRDGMVFTARQVFDIIECLKTGEIPDDALYTFKEISLWAGCNIILSNNEELIKKMRRGD